MSPIQINACHIISGDIWAGAESQAYSVIKGLSNLSGVKVNVITFNRGQLSSRIRACGIRLDEISEHSNNLISMARKIMVVLRREEVNLLHTHGGKENFIGGLAARLEHTKTIIRTHHGKGMVNGRIALRCTERFNAGFLTDRLIAVSLELKDFLVSMGYKKDKIDVIHNGIDPSSFTLLKELSVLRQSMSIKESCRIIGTIGRMESVKGHRYFLESAKHLLKVEKNLVFMIVGDGTLRTDSEKYATTLGIDDHVRFVGFRENPIHFLQLCDVFVLPSIHEGVPISLLEAMYLGKPIVATRVGGIPEIVDDACHGLLVDPCDSISLSDACLRLLREEKLSSMLASNAQQKARAELTSAATTEKTLQLYRGLF